MEKISPKTKPSNNEPYILEDKDYLLIKAIQELTRAIERLAGKMQYG
jgi:hypothetical protein